MIKLAKDKVIPSAQEDDVAAARVLEEAEEAQDEPSIQDPPRGEKDVDGGEG